MTTWYACEKTLMPSSAEPEGHALVEALTEFARKLRSEGLVVGSGQVTSYCQALARLDPGDLRDLYWAGCTCLVSRRSDIEIYDDVFTRYFLPGQRAGGLMKIKGEVPRGKISGVDLRGSSKPNKRVAKAPPDGMSASDVEVLRDKDFAVCTDQELEALRRLMAQILVQAPVRKVRRTERARIGDRLDMRAALRDAIRTDGVVFLRRWKRRRTKSRPLVLLLDISGSMAEYSRVLLQFAHTARQRPGRVEVFCFGTRLTRVSDALGRRNANEALDLAAHTVVDWESGTMIGESLREYNRMWGRRSGFRGGVVLICS
ncbi:MAG: VWA domain-containing protein, partial [Acidimicrobiia bacterium]